MIGGHRTGLELDGDDKRRSSAATGPIRIHVARTEVDALGHLLLVLDRLEQNGRHRADQLHRLWLDQHSGLLVPSGRLQEQALDVDAVFGRLCYVLIIHLHHRELPRQGVD